MSAAKSYLSNLLGVALAILAPIKTTLGATGFLIIADFLTGMMAARKRGEKITSAAARRTLSKMLIYNVCIISGFFLERYILEGDLPVVKVIAGCIGLIEIKSLLENANVILGIDIFKEALKKLGSQNDLPPK